MISVEKAINFYAELDYFLEMKRSPNLCKSHVD